MMRRRRRQRQRMHEAGRREKRTSLNVQFSNLKFSSRRSQRTTTTTTTTTEQEFRTLRHDKWTAPAVTAVWAMTRITAVSFHHGYLLLLTGNMKL